MLILLDRNVDLSVMFHHTWTYQALVHDLLDMKLNTITIPVTEKEKMETKTYDLDATSDSFWASNAGNPVPKVAGRQIRAVLIALFVSPPRRGNSGET